MLVNWLRKEGALHHSRPDTSHLKGLRPVRDAYVALGLPEPLFRYKLLWGWEAFGAFGDCPRTGNPWRGTLSLSGIRGSGHYWRPSSMGVTDAPPTRSKQVTKLGFTEFIGFTSGNDLIVVVVAVFSEAVIVEMH